ncbi:MAG: 3-deoxy-manno-octulosonate cytidylyltransferase, partial [Muribaculum intestinale]|nr:3-deoxy-manno-octulosonate cytidylyltransferase [Muribaculum intestinale]
MTTFIGIIPARYASSRFPGKPLADICGMTMIERVYRQASKELDEVVVATDDE